MKQKVINFFAGPGAGKSRLATRTFSELKFRDVTCELALEKTKEHEWEGRTGKVRQNQDYIFAKQHFQMRRLEGEVEFIVTDAPILLTLAYGDPNYLPSLMNVAIEAHERFENFNFFVRRGPGYDSKGRGQTREESVGLDENIHKILTDLKIPFVAINSIRESADMVANYVRTYNQMGKSNEDAQRHFLKSQTL